MRDSREEGQFVAELIHRVGGGRCVAIWGRPSRYRNAVFATTLSSLQSPTGSTVVEIDLATSLEEPSIIGPIIHGLLDIVPEDLHATEEYELLASEEGSLRSSEILGMANNLLTWTLGEQRKAFLMVRNPEAVADWTISTSLPVKLVGELLTSIRGILVPGFTVVLFGDSQILGELLQGEEATSVVPGKFVVSGYFDVVYPLEDEELSVEE